MLLEGGWAPHGYFRRTMFEAFLAHSVPPHRALWFAQCVYFSRSRCAAGFWPLHRAVASYVSVTKARLTTIICQSPLLSRML